MGKNCNIPNWHSDYCNTMAARKRSIKMKGKYSSLLFTIDILAWTMPKIKSKMCFFIYFILFFIYCCCHSKKRRTIKQNLDYLILIIRYYT